MNLGELLETFRDIDSARDRILDAIEKEAERLYPNDKRSEPTHAERMIYRYSAARAVMLYRRRVGKDLELSLQECRDAFQEN